MARLEEQIHQFDLYFKVSCRKCTYCNILTQLHKKVAFSPQSPSPHMCASLAVSTGKNHIFLSRSLKQDFYPEKSPGTL